MAAAEKSDTTRLLWIMGLALTLPMILLSGPLTGYLLGYYVLEKGLNAPKWTTPTLMAIGLLASGTQAFRLIQKIYLETKKRDTGPRA